MLYIIGNGPSRLDFDMEKLECYGCEWYGCNGIYQDYTPDLLFVHDIPLQHKAVVDGVLNKGKVALGDWNPMEIELYEDLKFMHSTMPVKIIENRSEDDTHFVVQGEGDEVYFTAYPVGANENIIMYNFPKLKNTFCGITALGYAAEQGHKQITLVGFDALDPNIDSVGNVYENSGVATYKPKYTKEDTIYWIQRFQFVSLLKDELFEDIDVFFENPLDNKQPIIYNELSYFEKCDKRWSLGESSLFDFR